MKELSSKELLEFLNEWTNLYKHELDCSEQSLETSEKHEQAYQQIRKRIEEKPKVTREEVYNFYEKLISIAGDEGMSGLTELRLLKAICQFIEDNTTFSRAAGTIQSGRRKEYIKIWLKSKGVKEEK